MSRFARLASVLLTLAFSFAAEQAVAARAVDSTVVNPVRARLVPESPCVGDTVTLVGDLCGLCMSFVGARVIDGKYVFVVRQDMRGPCPAGPCPQDSRRIPLGVATAERRVLDVVTWLIRPGPADGPDTTRIHQFVVLEPRLECGPRSGLPTIDEVVIDHGTPCRGCAQVICGRNHPFPVRLSGWLPNACWSLRDMAGGPSLPGRSYVTCTFTADTCRAPGACDSGPVRWERDVMVPAPILDYGDLRVWFKIAGCPDTSRVVQVDMNTVATFVVRDSCEPPPPPIDSLPYGLRVQVGGPAPCDTCPGVVCPGVPIPFKVSGAFPSACYRVLGMRILPLGAPFTAVQLEVENCDIACPLVATPFEASLLLPASSPGPQFLHFSVLERACQDSLRPARFWTKRIDYRVRESCEPTETACVWPYLWPARDAACSATMSQNLTASVDLAVRTGLPVAGLQGSIFVQWPLGITRVEAIGDAAGMRVVTQVRQGGVDWALFGLNGEQIRPTERGPILRVHLIAPADVPLPARMAVSSTVTVASDSLGGKAHLCDVRHIDIMAPTAWVCTSGGCDVNGDGAANVRDLIVMVNCLIRTGTCTLPPGFDCDGDSAFTIDDVLCCARRILHGGGSDTIPPRPGDGIAVRFGSPRRSGSGVEVPLALVGREAVGGMKLLLKFPADRFEFDAARFEGDASGWLAVHESRGPGEVALALVNLGSADLELPWMLALRLKPGAEPSGAVSVGAAELTGMNGGVLTTSVPGTASGSLAAAAAPRVGLAMARPNPFGKSTRFSVTLASGADVDLTVHDLAGRRVAVLHQGRLEAGSREFAWTGRADGGERAPDGVYFVRLRVDGRVWSQRVALLGGH